MNFEELTEKALWEYITKNLEEITFSQAFEIASMGNCSSRIAFELIRNMPSIDADQDDSGSSFGNYEYGALFNELIAGKEFISGESEGLASFLKELVDDASDEIQDGNIPNDLFDIAVSGGFSAVGSLQNQTQEGFEILVSAMEIAIDALTRCDPGDRVLDLIDPQLLFQISKQPEISKELSKKCFKLIRQTLMLSSPIVDSTSKSLIRFDSEDRNSMKTEEIASLFMDIYENYWDNPGLMNLPSNAAFQLCVIKSMSDFFELDPSGRGFSEKAFEFSNKITSTDSNLYFLLSDYWSELCRFYDQRCTLQHFKSFEQFLKWEPKAFVDFLNECDSTRRNRVIELFDFLNSKKSDDDLQDVLMKANDVSELAEELIQFGLKGVAFYVLGAFEMNQALVNSDYGSPDGFWPAHEEISAKLFKLAESLDSELLDHFRTTEYFSGAMGISLNPTWGASNLEWLATDVDRDCWGEEELAACQAAVAFNASNSANSILSIVKKFNLAEADAFCGLITNLLPRYGDFAELPQRLVADKEIPPHIREALVTHFSENEELFNDYVSWTDLNCCRSELLEALASR